MSESAPLLGSLSREEIITDGGIPEEIFDYIDGELSNAARGFWTATAGWDGVRYHNWQGRPSPLL